MSRCESEMDSCSEFIRVFNNMAIAKYGLYFGPNHDSIVVEQSLAWRYDGDGDGEIYIEVKMACSENSGESFDSGYAVLDYMPREHLFNTCWDEDALIENTEEVFDLTRERAKELLLDAGLISEDDDE